MSELEEQLASVPKNAETVPDTPVTVNIDGENEEVSTETVPDAVESAAKPENSESMDDKNVEDFDSKEVDIDADEKEVDTPDSKAISEETDTKTVETRKPSRRTKKTE